jgi:lipopolysaccharide export system permease protein
MSADGRRKGRASARPKVAAPSAVGRSIQAQPSSQRSSLLSRRPLPFGSRIDRYVAAHFVSSYATAMMLLTGLFLVMDMAGNLDDFLEVWEDGTSAPATYLVRYYVLTLPYLFLQVAPFVTLLAGMFTVNRLLSTNEVTAVLAAGVSARRLVMPVVLLGLALAAGMFGLREAVGRGISTERDLLRYVLEEHTFEVVFEDISVTDRSGSPALFDRFYPAPLDGGPPRAEGLKVIARTGRSGGRSDYIRTEAPSAVWGGEHWMLENGIRARIAPDRGQEKLEVAPVGELVGYRLEPEIVFLYRRAQSEPLELSFGEVRELIRREPEDLTYQTLWHYHLTFPLANVILLLVGLPLLFTYERGRGAERMALGGLLCVFYYAFDFVFRTMGLSGGFSPVLAAWVPVLLFGSLGVVLFDSMRS